MVGLEADGSPLRSVLATGAPINVDAPHNCLITPGFDAAEFSLVAVSASDGSYINVSL